MKKKLLLLVVFSAAFFLSGCALLQTIQALKGFSVDYNTYNPIYQNAEYYTVISDTTVTVSDTNIPDLTDVSSELYFMIDRINAYTYLEQTIDGVEKVSLYHNLGDYTIEYLIDDTTILPTIPVGEEQLDTNIFSGDSSFSLSDISNEKVLEEHCYDFDIYLTQMIDLDKLTILADKLSVFEEGLSVFDDALAHAVVTFTEEESVIDILATLTDYEITFEDGSHATLSITNHTEMRIPTVFELVDVFSDDYTFLTTDDIRLATKVYAADTQISVPMTAEQNGWIQVYLEAGTYDLLSDSWGYYSDSVLYDASENVIPYNDINMIQVTITEAGSYYFYIQPMVDNTLDLTFSTVVVSTEE